MSTLLACGSTGASRRVAHSIWGRIPRRPVARAPASYRTILVNEMACRMPDLTRLGHCLGRRIGGRAAMADYSGGGDPAIRASG